MAVDGPFELQPFFRSRAAAKLGKGEQLPTDEREVVQDDAGSLGG